MAADVPQNPSDFQLVLDSQTNFLQSARHKLVKRFAAPILNEIDPADSRKTAELDTNDVDKYYNLIRPTAADKEYYELIHLTKSERMPKDLSFDNHYKLDHNQLTSNSSGSLLTAEQISPTKFSSSMTAPTAIPNRPRQNQNPDIQDIITGIVKLLNGNVNVHANTQPPQPPPSRRPFTTRINNRGPPRISEAQPLPNDFIDQQQQQQILQQTIRPPPYPFDRPEPIRPFINGVPIPEQIVPSMQQNYRPGFVSQNRPPWQRPRPRPPISGNRRPGMPYKTYPGVPPPGYPPPQNEYPSAMYDSDPHYHTNAVSAAAAAAVAPPDADTYDAAPEDELTESEDESTTTEVIRTTTNEVPTKEELYKKKDKNKMTEKKPIPQAEEIQPTMTTAHFITTEPSTSAIDQSAYMSSDHVEPSAILESSIEDVAFPSIPTSSTPQLVTTETPSETELIQHTHIQSTSTTTSTAHTTSFGSVNHLKPTNQLPATGYNDKPYKPRPGVVLDDPEFKPGGGAYKKTQTHIITSSPVHPPGYGEIFDVTLSAVQGPGGGEKAHTTINVKPFDTSGYGDNDIIVAPTENDGYVSIDGKRSYIKLFDESTDGVPTPSSSVQATSSAIQPTSVVRIFVVISWGVVENKCVVFVVLLGCTRNHWNRLCCGRN